MNLLSQGLQNGCVEDGDQVYIDSWSVTIFKLTLVPHGKTAIRQSRLCDLVDLKEQTFAAWWKLEEHSNLVFIYEHEFP